MIVVTFNPFYREVERVANCYVGESNLIQVCFRSDFTQDGLIVGKVNRSPRHVQGDEYEAGHCEEDDEAAEDPALEVVEPAQAVDAARAAKELGPTEDQRTKLHFRFWSG